MTVILYKYIHITNELCFQVIHQSTERWLKLQQNEELAEAASELSAGHVAKATVLVKRGVEYIKLLAQQLEILTFMQQRAGS